MRPIEVEEGLRIRFPGRPEAFDVGVEVGLVTALMIQGAQTFQRRLSTAALSQLEKLAVEFRYRLSVTDLPDGGHEVLFTPVSARPRLSVVR